MVIKEDTRSRRTGYTRSEYLDWRAVRRFKTPPGKQAQVDWGHLGYLEINGQQCRVWGFTTGSDVSAIRITRSMWSCDALRPKDQWRSDKTQDESRRRESHSTSAPGICAYSVLAP